MTKQIPEQFEVTYEMLATKKQRFINYVADTAIIMIMYLLVLIVIEVLYRAADVDGPKFWLQHATKLEKYLLFSSLLFVYYFVCEAFIGGSIGKFITHTKILNEEGDKPSYTHILMRTIVRILPLEGFSFIGEYSHGWHDRLSKTVVVDIHKYEKELYNQRYLQAIGNNKSVA